MSNTTTPPAENSPETPLAQGQAAGAGRSMVSFRASESVIQALRVIQSRLCITQSRALELCVMRTAAHLVTDAEADEDDG